MRKLKYLLNTLQLKICMDLSDNIGTNPARKDFIMKGRWLMINCLPNDCKSLADKFRREVIPMTPVIRYFGDDDYKVIPLGPNGVPLGEDSDDDDSKKSSDSHHTGEENKSTHDNGPSPDKNNP